MRSPAALTAALAAIGVLAVLPGRAWGAQPQVTVLDPAQVRTLATAVHGPEGPSVLPDGSVAMVEFTGGDILHVSLDGTHEPLAHTGIGIAGTAMGRDGALYAVKLDVAKFRPGPARPAARASAGGPAAAPAATAAVPPAGGGLAALASSPAAVLRVDLTTHAVRTLYTQYHGEALQAPDDLAIDRWGDIWFTDVTANAVYWARADGSDIRQPITDVPGVNGITLSPDGRTIYIIGHGQLLAYTIAGRGRLRQAHGQPQARVVATLDPALHAPDGMKTEADGDILLACWQDGVLRYSSTGRLISQTRIPGIQIIDLAFGGKDGRTLYLATNPLGKMTGSLMSITWPQPGLVLP